MISGYRLVRLALPGLLMAAGILAAQRAFAQSASAAPTEMSESLPGALRLFIGPTFVFPRLDGPALTPFRDTGEFDPAPGLRFGAGIHFDLFEARVMADLAGLEAGDTIVERGIGRGRQTAILHAYAIEFAWSPQREIWYGIRPNIGVGYVRGAIDNYVIAPERLDAELRAFAEPRTGEGEEHPAGIGSAGFRLALAGKRDVGDKIGVRFVFDADFQDVSRFIYRFDSMEWDGGKYEVPRVSLLLRWAP